jgi:hypothetical protein
VAVEPGASGLLDGGEQHRAFDGESRRRPLRVGAGSGVLPSAGGGKGDLEGRVEQPDGVGGVW